MPSSEVKPAASGAVLAYRMKDAAHVLGLSVTTLYEMRRKGELPAVRIAGRALIPAEALRRLLAEAPAARPDDGDERAARARHAGAVRRDRASPGAAEAA